MKNLFFTLIMSLGLSFASASNTSILQQIIKSKPLAVLNNGRITNTIKIQRKWTGYNCKIEITNTSRAAVNLREIVLFSINKQFAPNTPIYAEGFQLLSQTVGTLQKPVDLGYYTDRGHYKIENPANYRVVYNLLNLSPSQNNHYLMGFSSSNRFVGKFLLSADTVKVVMDLENISLPAGATWKLEDFFMAQGADRNTLYDNFSAVIGKNHPRLQMPEATGWCSWTCFGPEVTAQNVYNNLTTIKQYAPSLKYIQIDDGFQANMGDWMTIGKSFNGGIIDVLKKIKLEGFEPAIWVAPFICDTNSVIYKEHKDWLLKDENNKPLRSDKVGFGGWRLAPWYVLDGTNPAVQKHFENLFRAMHEEWGITYFKLDANYWATIPHAKYFRKNATRTEAYREGMKAILKGAGNSFVLGCNQPMWPSLGVVHASRTSMDIAQDFNTMLKTGRENLYRAWQNNKLWWNDPDCLILTDKGAFTDGKHTSITENQFMFHASLLYATGGMLLSGDDVATIPQNRIAILQKLAVPTGIAAKFNADTFDYGWVATKEGKRLVVLNWGKNKKNFSIPIDKPCILKDFFTGKEVGKFRNEIRLMGFAGEYGNVFIVENDQ